MISFFMVNSSTTVFLEISMTVLPMHNVLLPINLAAVLVEQQKYAKIEIFAQSLDLSALSQKIG